MMDLVLNVLFPQSMTIFIHFKMEGDRTDELKWLETATNEQIKSFFIHLVEMRKLMKIN